MSKSETAPLLRFNVDQWRETMSGIVERIVWRLGRRKREREIERLWASQGSPDDFPIIRAEGLVIREDGRYMVTDWTFDTSRMREPISLDSLTTGLAERYPHRFVSID